MVLRPERVYDVLFQANPLQALRGDAWEHSLIGDRVFLLPPNETRAQLKALTDRRLGPSEWEFRPGFSWDVDWPKESDDYFMMRIFMTFTSVDLEPDVLRLWQEEVSHPFWFERFDMNQDNHIFYPLKGLTELHVPVAHVYGSALGGGTRMTIDGYDQFSLRLESFILPIFHELEALVERASAIGTGATRDLHASETKIAPGPILPEKYRRQPSCPAPDLPVVKEEESYSRKDLIKWLRSLGPDTEPSELASKLHEHFIAEVTIYDLQCLIATQVFFNRSANEAGHTAEDYADRYYSSCSPQQARKVRAVFRDKGWSTGEKKGQGRGPITARGQVHWDRLLKT